MQCIGALARETMTTDPRKLIGLARLAEQRDWLSDCRRRSMLQLFRIWGLNGGRRRAVSMCGDLWPFSKDQTDESAR